MDTHNSINNCRHLCHIHPWVEEIVFSTWEKKTEVKIKSASRWSIWHHRTATPNTPLPVPQNGNANNNVPGARTFLLRSPNPNGKINHPTAPPFPIPQPVAQKLQTLLRRHRAATEEIRDGYPRDAEVLHARGILALHLQRDGPRMHGHVNYQLLVPRRVATAFGGRARGVAGDGLCPYHHVEALRGVLPVHVELLQR